MWGVLAGAPRGLGSPSSLLRPCRLRELCVKLMFLHPVDYGRKAEELLWRKVYYEVIQLIKTNKKVGEARARRGAAKEGRASEEGASVCVAGDGDPGRDGGIRRN